MIDERGRGSREGSGREGGREEGERWRLGWDGWKHLFIYSFIISPGVVAGRINWAPKNIDVSVDVSGASGCDH